MSKRLWIIIALLALGLGIVYKVQSSNSTNNSGSSTNGTKHIQGLGSSGVTLVEYGDYQCPYCAEYYPFVKEAVAKYNDKIYFQFKNYPLAQVHQNAFAAARAAEAAGLMGKFWEMHDLLYEQNIAQINNKKSPSWVTASNPQTYFDAYAKSLGLNVAKFDSNFSGSQANDLINGDINQFNKTGAQEATPTFFLDGKQIQPQASAESIEAFIKAEIDKKQGKNSTAPASSSGGNQSVQPTKK